MCNTDRASRGNPGISSYTFCIRDELGDLVYAKAEGIGEATNTQAEMIAIKEALRYCRDRDFNKIRHQATTSTRQITDLGKAGTSSLARRRNKFISSKEVDRVTVRFMSNDSAASQLIR
ncbi:uncharacterized protein LOC132624247 [Lycium barbarum]|uniref:uncharacterized protein LOC132624247 n=1 Tax=Lycium barbarum TaxID=112863 RepID=UPI00293E1F10|nr:uncharacterized protein LOC132624247 [Lycium barbarum]